MDKGPSSPVRRALGPVLLLALLTLGAVGFRLLGLSQAMVDRDSLHPVYDSLLILSGERFPLTGRPALGFNHGYLQPWFLVPFAALSQTLEQFLVSQAVLHGLVVVPVGLAARRLGGPGAGWIAAAWVAFLPALVVMPAGGSQCYQAPFLVGVSVLCAAIALTKPSAGATFGLAASLAAAFLIHPYALAVVMGASALLPGLARRQAPKVLAGAVLVFGLMVLPTVADNLHRWQTEAGRSQEGLPAAPMDNPDIRGSAPSRFLQTAALQGGHSTPWRWGALGMMGVVLLGGVVRRRTPRERDAPARALIDFAFVSQISLGILFYLLDYLREYHFALMAPLGAVAAMLVVQRAVPRALFSLGRGWKVAGAVGILLMAFFSREDTETHRPSFGPQGSRLAVVDRAAAIIRSRSQGKEVWVAALTEISAPPGVMALPQGNLVMPITTARRLAGDYVPEQPLPLPSGVPYPKAFLLGEMNDSLWSVWMEAGARSSLSLADTPLTLMALFPRPGIQVGLLEFRNAQVAARWIRAGCAVLLPGLNFQVDGPIDREDLERRYLMLDQRVTGWPGPCPTNGEIRWWEDTY